ncbi:MAG: UDP-glucose 4-epimerase GalE [Bacteroidales bacterium]
MMAKILVTGGLGYIGSHTVVELIKHKHDVIIIDNLSNSDIIILEKIYSITNIMPAYEQVDICDMEKLNTVFSTYPNIDAIIHFAAFKAVGESVEDSLKYYKNNVSGMIHILQCMKTYNVPHIIFSSSCTVYGQPAELPVTEKAPIQKATSPYGNTKQICEEILSDAIHSYNSFSAIILRYFNPVGAHESGIIGELPKGVPNNLVPFITQTAAGIRDELKIFGDDYNTPDGSAIRDYIYVVDLARAHVIAANRLITNSNKRECEVFNLGTGTGVSVLEMVHTFEKATGIQIPYTIVERRAGDIEKVWADTKYANTELGWKAETPLKNILASAWEWEKNIRHII